MRELLKLLAHPTRFERVAFAFGGQTPTPPVPEQRIRTNRERGVLQAPRQPRHIPYPAQCTAVDEGAIGRERRNSIFRPELKRWVWSTRSRKCFIFQLGLTDTLSANRTASLPAMTTAVEPALHGAMWSRL